MKFNRETFLTLYKDQFSRLSPSQKDGLLFLLDKIEADDWQRVEEVAYLLATIYWECRQTFQPIKESREAKNSPRRANQDRYWLTGFYGRGFAQITWRENYEKFGKLLGLPLTIKPDLVLEPETAYKIISIGMKKGLFRKKKLSDFIGAKVNYRGARAIINGNGDKADLIASVAVRFETILRKSLVVEVVEAPAETPAAPAEDAISHDDLSKFALAKSSAVSPLLKRILLQLFGWAISLWQLGLHGKVLLIVIALAVLAGGGYEIYKHRVKVQQFIKQLAAKFIKS